MSKDKNKDKKNLHSGHRDRVRFRLERDIEMEAFNEHEMLEYLLFHGIPRKDTNNLAHELINTFGSFGNVFNASVADLLQVKDMTKSSALLIKSILPISRAISISRSKGRKYLYSSDDAIAQFSGYFINESRELAYVACLDISDRIISVTNIGKGTAANTSIDLQKLIQTVSSTNANKIILLHNHPSGNVFPSDSDILTTNYAMLSLYAYKTKLLDHLIFAPSGQYFSFFQNQIMDTLVGNINKLLSTDITTVYSAYDNVINYYDKGVRLNEDTRTAYLNRIGNFFDSGDDTIAKILHGLNTTDDKK